jgi:hypothetical protein
MAFTDTHRWSGACVTRAVKPGEVVYEVISSVGDQAVRAGGRGTSC